ncbi:DUF551 domain-containing protein [Salmonella enterica]
MTALNKQTLRVPERKRRDWSQAVMRDCDFCSQWSLTIHHEDGGCICASCCDAEYTSELKSALESAIDRAEAAEKRIAELEARVLPEECPIELSDQIVDICDGIIVGDVAAQMIWDSFRAAMLQAGNHTEQYLDMVDHSGDANHKADCRLPFDKWLSQQNELIDVDCGCVTTEAFYHWMRVAYEAGKSPVTPDGWIPVSERMPEKLIPVMVMYEDGEMWSAMWNGNRWDDGTEYPDPHAVTHWREMPAAPQQEVKSE